jgi:carboxylesterase type B
MSDVQAWLGIQYAASPVGKLQAPASWEGVRAMDRYGNWAK